MFHGWVMFVGSFLLVAFVVFNVACEFMGGNGKAQSDLICFVYEWLILR